MAEFVQLIINPLMAIVMGLLWPYVGMIIFWILTRQIVRWNTLDVLGAFLAAILAYFVRAYVLIFIFEKLFRDLNSDPFNLAHWVFFIFGKLFGEFSFGRFGYSFLHIIITSFFLGMISLAQQLLKCYWFPRKKNISVINFSLSMISALVLAIVMPPIAFWM